MKTLCNWGLTEVQSSAVHIRASYSADVILPGSSAKTSTFNYKFSFSSGRTVGQFPNCTKPRTLAEIIKMYKFLIKFLFSLYFALLLFSCNSDRKITQSEITKLKTEHQERIKVIRWGFDPYYDKIPDSMKKWIKVFSNVLADDQKNRIRGVKSNQEELKEQIRLDSQNLKIVTEYIDKYGWPAKYEIGFVGQRAIGMVIQHSPLKVQEKYYSSLVQTYKRDSSLFEFLALLEDRINVRNHKYQYYGTQVVSFKGKSMLYPVVNIDSIDIYRKRLGNFMPIADYLKSLKVNWNIDQYKRSLPDLKREFKISNTLGVHYQRE